jgi:enoyl-CoA hydratase/carnithine racemase
MHSLRLLRRFADDSLVQSSNHNFLAKVKLCRPKALNSLNIAMIDRLQSFVYDWDKDPQMRLVFFSADGAKAFCAGGDVRALYDAKKESKPSVFSEFFWKEYVLDYSLTRMRPLQVCLYDGLVMGGGVGISIHAPIRIATASSVFSMPEAAIGLYPDVAGSYFLPRLPSCLGLYLAISAGRLSGKELVQAGVATHYVEPDKLDALKEALIASVQPDTPLQAVEQLVSSFATETKGPLPEIESIEKYFAGVKNVEEIFERLQDKTPWSVEKAKAMEKLCPVTLKVTFEQMKRGAKLSLRDVFKMEYRMSMNFMQAEDFFEGFRAMLLDKDKNPQWQYKTLADVSEDVVKAYFEPPTGNFVDLDVEKEFNKGRLS